MVGAQAAIVALAACAPKAPTTAPDKPQTEVLATPVPIQPAVEIEFDAGGFTPSKYTGEQLEEAVTLREAFDVVANDYMGLHPNVKIKFVPIPMVDRREAMITQLAGGTAPDMMWTQPDWVNEDLGKGWWLSLDPFLDMPSPYASADHPGSKRWHDGFHPSVDFWRAPDGHLYMLLGDQTQVGIYYNEDLFAKAGITKEPRMWEELMAACQTLADQGVTPFAWCGGGRGVLDQLTWVSGWFAKYFFWNHIPTYDKDGSGWPDKWEMAEAIREQTFTAHMEENIARLRTLRRMASYWQEGALGMDWEATHRLFLTGGGATIITGVWMLHTYLDDPERDFELGWFYFPGLDKATSPLIPDNVPMTNLAAGYGSFQYALTATALKKGTSDACADFLMFATTPENIGKIVNEMPYTVPNVKGADLHPLTIEMGFAESISYPPSTFQEDDSLLDFEYGMNLASVVAPYCVGQLPEEQTLDLLQGYMDAAAERVLATKPG
jgi:ABC-type glycerol-3-phosphate transport system substrate-binding protein